jgi:lysozyme
MLKVAIIDLAAALIAVFEGERLTSYQDSGGVWTIGFGHTKDVQAGQAITHEDAVNLFSQDVAPLMNQVNGRRTLEAAALISFGYNCGAGALSRVLLGQDSISTTRHTTDRKGQVLRGLVARRRLEQMLIAVSGEVTT